LSDISEEVFEDIIFLLSFMCCKSWRYVFFPTESFWRHASSSSINYT